jgi:hypothetical protein
MDCLFPGEVKTRVKNMHYQLFNLKESARTAGHAKVNNSKLIKMKIVDGNFRITGHVVDTTVDIVHQNSAP